MIYLQTWTDRCIVPYPQGNAGRDIMLGLVRQIAFSIAELEAMANQQATLANDLDTDSAADAIRQVAQHHRRRADELRSELASLGLKFAAESTPTLAASLGTCAP